MEAAASAALPVTWVFHVAHEAAASGMDGIHGQTACVS